MNFEKIKVSHTQTVTTYETSGIMGEYLEVYVYKDFVVNDINQTRNE